MRTGGPQEKTKEIGIGIEVVRFFWSTFDAAGEEGGFGEFGLSRVRG